MKFLSEKQMLKIQQEVADWILVPSSNPNKDIKSFLMGYTTSVQSLVYVATVLCAYAKYPNEVTKEC